MDANTAEEHAANMNRAPEKLVRVLVSGYLKCPKCGNTDHAVSPGNILDGVFCCDFMEPVGKYVVMSQKQWMREGERLTHTTGWEKHYTVIKRDD